ncbi:GNAT family N-acetyltransferase [Phenylobacterium sp.]|uniref:GNAT family N-acetyltransferase n=1 Tax=Phenylobacterium sp. TaxID=1871053 RepID=UPI002735B900|nr:GNAT family N-acetyltransferase [Phenylobacterium sp.]MDP3659916.1 GNAT family N-acetyltransferase [Phenylobacterium sp.]
MIVERAEAADLDEIGGLLAEGAAWMHAKGTPAWTYAEIAPAALAARIAEGAFICARSEGTIVGVCMLSRVDLEFWPDDPLGEAGYLHRLCVRRSFAGARVTPLLVDWCVRAARAWRCKALRLDCHPNLRGLYERLGFTYVDTRTIQTRGARTIVVDRLQISLRAPSLDLALS